MNKFQFLQPGSIAISAFLLLCSPGSAQTLTFGDLKYTTDGTSVTITGFVGSPTSIVIPAEINGLPVRTIARPSPVGTFARTTATSVSIPDSVTTIDYAAFADFVALRSITLPDSVTSLGGSAFARCTSLAAATLSNGLTTLEYTFYACTALTSVTLPNNATTLTGTFWNCTSLSTIVLPETVTTIGASTFQGCTNLTEIDLPSGVTVIGEDAFAGCSNLSRAPLPQGITTIGNGAFKECAALTDVDFPATLTSIGSSAFEGCGLTSLTVPDTVTLIGDNAFWGNNLASMNLPDRFLASLASIGLDYKPQLATDALIAGIANNLANNPDFVSKLADEIISKNGHYGLSTQADVTDLANQVPQTVRTVLAQVEAEQPQPDAITSDLNTLSATQGTSIHYEITTNFGANAFAATGLPPGSKFNSATGVITGWPSKVGTYPVFLHAAIPGGRVVSVLKVFEILPRPKAKRKQRHVTLLHDNFE